VGTYDALLLDLFWTDRPDGKEHGLNLCRLVREKFPELPIIIFSGEATVEQFQELIPLSISAYLSKSTLGETWCVAVRDALYRAYVDRSGLPLYRTLRQFLGRVDAWNPDVINEAASEVWRRESGRDKWDGFWEAVGNLTARHRVKLPVDFLKNYFAASDLFSLGIVPSMRGHLEHVLYVYFTGYVISHRLPIFKRSVIKAARDLLGHQYSANQNQHYWDLFQIAWLLCATLHDTAYSLELVPDFWLKLKEVEKTFPFAAISNISAKKITAGLDWTKATHAQAAFEQVFKKFDYGKVASSWISDNAVFTDDRGVRRINHGVASGIAFMESFAVKCSHMMHEDISVLRFFQWAATAMALHSLKLPGHKQGVTLRLRNDPLSFLLLLCDELQVWDRDRPDAEPSSNAFRRTELASLTINRDHVAAEIRYVPYAGVLPTHKTHAGPVEDSILKESPVLSAYLDPSPLTIQLDHTIRGTDMILPSLELKRRSKGAAGAA